MSGRLASFRGPSSPSSSPVARPRNASTPNSPSNSRANELPFHRKLRTNLQEIRKVTETWDDIVCIDGAKAAKALIDARTNLDNALAQVPADKEPQSRIVGSQIEIMERSISVLDSVLVKLQKQFRRLSTLVDNIESLVFEAHKAKGWTWVHEEPMWVTWPLEKFATSIPAILIPYHRSLQMHTQIVDSLRSHSVSFDVSKDALNRWMAQPWLQEDGWEAAWDDLCAVEVERWDGA
ncbi:hypothetical protein FIBSPDRAFT_823250 [Athelia psychrophila]|uniref:Uncharacterized protein n=1 Tax=Athelia psychrophila TaxID=1759441 RepID=A0A166M4X4_9AGAM|nr:hypothetical protein FIBSPDRAFT_823250 [Fibularhizoctonia sp. CBS 109695]